MQSLLLIFLSYFLGSIPTAYLVTRLYKGKDIRNYGSGTVSASMVYEHIAKWMVVPVGIFYILKAAFPTWLALYLGLGEATAAAAGMAAVLGHNWSIFLHFEGGRGISPFLGLTMVLFPWGVLYLLIFLAIGFVLGDSAPWALASIVSMPLLIYWLDGSEVMYYAILVMLLVMLIKRVEANGRQLPPAGELRRVIIVRRLIFDRNISDHRQWIDRRF